MQERLLRKKDCEHTFSSTLEEESNHQHLQCRHANHHHDLHQAEIKYPSLRALHRAEIPVLTCSEVFLHAADGA